MKKKVLRERRKEVTAVGLEAIVKLAEEDGLIKLENTVKRGRKKKEDK